MRQILTFVFFVSIFLVVPINVQASTTPQQTSEEANSDLEINAETFVNEQVENLEISDIKTYWDEVMTKYGGFLPESQKGSLLQFLNGEKELSFQEWIKAFLKFMFHELIANGKLLGTLISVSYTHLTLPTK